MKFILLTHGCMASLNPSKSSQLRDLPGGAVAVTAAGFFKAFGMAKMAYLDHCREFHRNSIRCGFIKTFFHGLKKPCVGNFAPIEFCTACSMWPNLILHCFSQTAEAWKWSHME